MVFASGRNQQKSPPKDRMGFKEIRPLGRFKFPVYKYIMDLSISGIKTAPSMENRMRLAKSPPSKGDQKLKVEKSDMYPMKREKVGRNGNSSGYAN